MFRRSRLSPDNPSSPTLRTARAQRSAAYGAPCLVLVCLIPLVTAEIDRPALVYAHADKKLEGAELFSARGCSHCHGVNGEGTDTGPKLQGVRSRLSAAQIEHQIVAGGKQMPAFGSTLDGAQVESLVAFLRAKTWIAAPPLPANEDPGSQAEPDAMKSGSPGASPQ